MPRVIAACWTMTDIALGGADVGGRTLALDQVAREAETQLRLLGRQGAAPGVRLFVVPEYFFNAGGGLVSRSDKHAIYRRLEGISASIPDVILVAGTIAYSKGIFSTDVRSVSPILLGGQIMKKLYKAHDDGVYQINGAFRTKTDQGKGVPLVQLQGVSIGVDICMDYNRERMKAYIAAHGLQLPDIHIHISGTNAYGAVSASPRVGGLYLHCDLGGKGTRAARAGLVTGFDGVTAQVADLAPSRQYVLPLGRMTLFDATI
jgi:predicted amidohydrolase